MTVKELIKILRTMDPNKVVAVRTADYEDFGDDGFDRVYNDYEVDLEDIYEDGDYIIIGE